jgi:hypothetical protein
MSLSGYLTGAANAQCILHKKHQGGKISHTE